MGRGQKNEGGGGEGIFIMTVPLGGVFFRSHDVTWATDSLTSKAEETATLYVESNTTSRLVTRTLSHGNFSIKANIFHSFIGNGSFLDIRVVPR